MDEISLSLEETNKLRISQGLKPIPIPLSRPTEAVEVVSKADVPTTTEDHFRVSGPSLLEEDTTPVNLDDWLANLGSAPLKAPVGEEAVGEPSAEGALVKEASFDEGCTPSLSLGHTVKDLETVAEGAIFTLKDADVLDESDTDQLVNAEVEALRKLKAELTERKKMGKVGSKVFEEEVESGAENGDTLTSAPKELPGFKRFTLSDDELVAPVDDFAPIKMKKKKRVRETSSRKRQLDEDLPLQRVDLTEVSGLGDDEELQSMLALSRVKRQKARKRMTTAELAAEVQLFQEEERETVGEDATEAFLEGLESVLLVSKPMAEPLGPVVEAAEVVEAAASTLGEANLSPVVKEPPTQRTVSHSADTVSNAPPTPLMAPTVAPPIPRTFDTGLSDTLRFLESRNVIATKTEAEITQDRLNRECARKAELSRLQQEIDQRVQKEAAVEGPRKRQVVDRQILRDQADRLKDYNPQVKLHYTDDYNRELNTKEAFKHMSRQFHGTGPGKAKVEKTLKQIEAQREAQQLATLL